MAKFKNRKQQKEKKKVKQLEKTQTKQNKISEQQVEQPFSFDESKLFIQEQMSWTKQNKFSLVEKKKQNRNKTYLNTEKKMYTIMKKYKTKYGESDIRKIDSKKMQELLIGTYDNHFTIKSMKSAIYLFQESLKHRTEKEDKEGLVLDLIDKKLIEKYFDDNDMKRYSKTSNTGKLNQETYNELHSSLKKTHYAHGEKAAEYLEFHRHTAARLIGSVNCRGRDITINNDGTVCVYLQEKSNQERWVQITNPESIRYLKDKKASLKNQDWWIISRPMFKQGKKEGTRMNNETVQQEIGKVTNKIVQKYGFSDGEKNVSQHAARKFKAQEWAVEYAGLTSKELEELLEKRIKKHDELRNKAIEKDESKKSIPSAIQKYKTAKNRINWVRMPGSRGKHDEGKRRTKVDRKLNYKETILFLTSLQTGHYRIDVMRQYYVDIEKAIFDARNSK